LLASPPYERARLYLEGGKDLSIARDTAEWVAWMVSLTRAALRVVRGCVVWVVEGQTNDFRWSAAPALLMADLTRAGVTLRKPPVYRRNGIPGSGGPDWLRNDYEFCIVATRGGKLPWSDNTACGHSPKWGPGGEMSNRLSSGTRVNQWGRQGGKRGAGNVSPSGEVEPAARPSHVDAVLSTPTDAPGQLGLDGLPVEPPSSTLHPLLQGGGRGKGIGRDQDGSRVVRLSKRHTKRLQDGEMKNQSYCPPVLANPGNVIDCTAGGGHMGSALAHDNEAPFPEKLAEFFVRSFCPPGGIVCDPFSGSGTTAAVALRWGRRAVACDLRTSQVTLTRRRLMGETPSLFDAVPAEAPP
jgi:hypothetical protein